MALAVPALDLTLATISGRLATGCLLAAVGLQALTVWDYAIYSSRTVGQLVAARNLVGRCQKVAPLLTGIRSRFRANPLLHGESWLGIRTGNILLSNYEARYYYFPVQFRPDLDHPDPKDFERLSLTSDPRAGETCARLWERILTGYADSIDRVVAWKSDPLLEPITGRWFDLAGQHGDVRVFAPRAARVLKKTPEEP